ncbi:hypothetical protein [Streptomyces sp. NPDC058614]|uniref:hypothetical protein n=1 Tax=Streptomyces sp. NPDC058614 TaxID=3346557 RepID=UPI0036614262
MAQPITRNPYNHALHQINEVSEQTNRVTGTGDGTRPITPMAMIAVLTARSNLAIASALLAVADALRPNQP